MEESMDPAMFTYSWTLYDKLGLKVTEFIGGGDVLSYSVQLGIGDCKELSSYHL